LCPAKGVWEAVGEVNFGVFLLELVAKAEFVIFLLTLLTIRRIVQSTWLVANEIAALLPSITLFDANTHTLMIETMRLCEVKD